MWDLPGPGLEPVSPALGGGFLTTAPPGKSLQLIFMPIEINSNFYSSSTLLTNLTIGRIVQNFALEVSFQVVDKIFE